MVTELVGHHVVISRSAKLGPIHSPPTHTLSTLMCFADAVGSRTCAIALPAIITLSTR